MVERALCNTVLGGISKEGKSYFYVNPLEVWPQNCLASTSMAHVTGSSEMVWLRVLSAKYRPDVSLSGTI